MILGADFLTLRAEQLAFDRLLAEEAGDGSEGSDSADFDVAEVDPTAGDGADTADDSDTVNSDG